MLDKVEQAEKIGLERGMKKGIEQGSNNEKIAIAKSMLKKDMSLDLIAEITGLSLNQIEELK